MIKKTQKLPGLFIGRFQPFHLGHLDAFRQILKQEKKVIVAIGSAEKNRSDKNPFTARERYLMIDQTLKRWRARITIIPVCDINDDNLWANYLETLLPPFGNVYTGSSYVKRLFQKDGKHAVISIKKNLRNSGTLIRKQMQHGKKWKQMVPKAVVKVIKNNLQVAAHISYKLPSTYGH